MTTTEKAPLRSRFRLVSLFIVLLGAVFLWMSLQLPLGTFQAPGAGMWPVLVSGFLMATAVFVLLTERDGSDYEGLTKRSIISVGGFVWIGFFVVMFANVGLTISALVFSLVWLKLFARESWRFTIIATVLFTVAFVVIFPVLLGVPTPHDPVLSLITGGRY